MSTLNSRLKLSILNRKKGKNLAEKGFTLIELLITVVILGTLSAIALPGFLNQQEKAKAQAANAEVMAAARSCATERIDGPVSNAGVQTAWARTANLAAASGTANVCNSTGTNTFVSAVGGITSEATASLDGTGKITLTKAVA